jgi:23S rRNA G2445 N2-methylase RlmL
VIHSRIEHEGAATRTVHRAIQRRFESRGIAAPTWAIRGEPELPSSDPLARQRVLVHVEDNLCTISLDMTGGHLHQRGYRLKHAGAPLRETLAAAILMRSGWDGETPLVDGMCGAGTFAIEAGLMACGMPPGGRRPFLFESWPSFEDKTWAYLRRKAEEQAAARPGAPILGVDLDPASLEISRENARRAGLENAIQWVPADFFQLDPGKLGLPPGTVVLNPPYGRRLRENPARTYERVGAHLREAFGGWRAVVLAPDRESAMKLRMRQARAWKVSHGGAPVVVMMGRME